MVGGVGTERGKEIQQILLEIAAEVDPELAKTFQEVIKEDEALGRAVEQTNEQLFNIGVRTEGFAEKMKGAGPVVQESMDMSQRSTSRFHTALQDVHGQIQTIFAVFAGALWAGIVIGGIRMATQAMRNFVRAARNAVDTAFELVQSYEAHRAAYQALVEPPELAIEYLRILRVEAARTGQEYTNLVESARGLIPYAGDDPEIFERLVRTMSLLRAFKPEQETFGAMMAIQQALAQDYTTLQRRFNVSIRLIRELLEEGYYGLDLLEEALKRMGIQQDLIDAQARQWEGIKATLISIGEYAILMFSEDTFAGFLGFLWEIRTVLVENQEQIAEFARRLGESFSRAMARVRDVLWGPEGFSITDLQNAIRWGAELAASIARGLLMGLNLYILPALRAIISAISGVTIRVADVVRAPVIPPSRHEIVQQEEISIPPHERLEGETEAEARARRQAAVEPGTEPRIRAPRPELAPEDIPTPTTPAAREPSLTPEEIEELKARLISEEEYNEILAERDKLQQRIIDATIAYEQAQQRVRDIRREIARFDRETAEIPERYKRARRRELEEVLERAQIQQEARQQELRDLRRRERHLSDIIREQDQIRRQLEQIAGAGEDAADGIDDAAWSAWEGMVEAVELTESWEQLLADVHDEFEGLGDELEEVALQIKAIADVLPEATEGTLDNIRGISEWWREQPQWFKNMLKFGAVGIVLNFFTMGLLSQLTAVLAGVGIKAVGNVLLLPLWLKVKGLGVAIKAAWGAFGVYAAGKFILPMSAKITGLGAAFSAAWAAVIGPVVGAIHTFFLEAKLLGLKAAFAAAWAQIGSFAAGQFFMPLYAKFFGVKAAFLAAWSQFASYVSGMFSIAMSAKFIGVKEALKAVLSGSGFIAPILGTFASILLGVKIGEVIAVEALGTDTIQEMIDKYIFSVKFFADVDESSIISAIAKVNGLIAKGLGEEFDSWPWYVRAILWLTPFGPAWDFLSGDIFKGIGGEDVGLFEMVGQVDIGDTFTNIFEGIKNVFSGPGKKQEMEDVVREGVSEPVMTVAEQLQMSLVGESIFPDMLTAIVTLFTRLPRRLDRPLRLLLRTFTIYMRRLFDTVSTWMKTIAEAYVIHLQFMDVNTTWYWNKLDLDVKYWLLSIYKSVEFYAREIVRVWRHWMEYLEDPVTGDPYYDPDFDFGDDDDDRPRWYGRGGIVKAKKYQSGGIIPGLAGAVPIVAHAGELILNMAQQKNLLGNMAGMAVGQGMINVNSRHNWNIEGDMSPEFQDRLLDLVDESTYSAIVDVFREAHLNV